MNWGLIFRASGQAALGPDAVYFALAAIGLNIQFGYTGLLNFGQAGFAAAGAYGLAVAVITYGLSFWLGLAIGLLAAVLLALILGFPTLRLRTDYLAIVTIAASEIIRLIVRSVRYTHTLGGTDGLQAFGARFFELNPIDGGTYTPLKFRPDQVWLLLWAWPLVALCCLITFMLMRSPWGRVIKAIREDEDAVRSLGKNVYWYKMQSLVLGGVFGALSGIVFALSKQSVNPDDYATKFTFTALAVLILGGTARVVGPVLGAIVFIGSLQLLDTFLRQAITAGYVPDWLPVDQTKVGIIRLILVGVAIITLMVFRPQGILGDRREVAIRDR
jgi:ABC-type branched-subunit amino acid transport system permease subunit